MVGIPPGATLHFGPDETDDDEPGFTALVHSRRRITFEGAETSLTAAANEIRQRLGQPTYWLSAANLWYFEGESLAERRERLEGEGDD